MNYASVCDGIGAVHAAWQPLGWRCAWHAEIDPFPAAVVAHRWGERAGPNIGDITKITDEEIERHGPIELLVGGTPCQSFSVAGLRAGMADPRGNLALVFLRLAARARAKWVVWENVPGVLSSNGGRDFGAFLGGLAELGYGFAYRVLDAQYVRVDSHPRAVPQRRRRVFVVGCLGDWRRPAAVLLERESLRGDPPPRRDAGTGVANALEARPTDERLRSEPGHLIPEVAHSLRAEGFDASEDGTGRGTPIVAQAVAFHATQDPISSSERTPALSAKAQIGVAIQDGRDIAKRQNGCGISDDGSAYTLDTTGAQATIDRFLAVRRLTPRECERLQGFPDDYTLIPYGPRGGRKKGAKPAKDGPRYKALGNSMAVNVMSWLGRRINKEVQP